MSMTVMTVRIPMFQIPIVLHVFAIVLSFKPLFNIHKKFPRLQCNASAKYSSSKSDNDNHDGNLKSRFVKYLNEKLEVTDGSKAVYDVNQSCLAIVDQFFPYIQRQNDNDRIIENFVKRQQAWKVRNYIKGVRDKDHNPLLAIPGAPGSGKSAFLANFPASDEFQKYCALDTDSGSLSAIVAPLTFNSMMDTCFESKNRHYSTFGLRILYGAAVVMREKDIATNEFMTWEYFLSNFEDNYNCSATAAVNILREVYGINRRVLVLVDELAKLDDDANEKVVMREIGQLLTSSHKIDVIVSALSPEYVDTLVTRTSARVIKYVILDSLVGSRLGRNETREWSVELLREYGKSDEEIDEFAINFLCNIELLLSGHPRSLQRLVESFAAKSEWGLYWTNTIELIRDAKIESKGTMPEIMKAVMDDLFGTEDNPVYSLLETKIPGTPTKIVKYLDLALQFVVPENPQFRSYLENGAVYILPKTSYTPKRRTTIPLVTFLQLVSILAEPKVYPRLLASHSRARTAVLLFKNSTVNMAELFESAVGLTAVCHSYLAISSYMKTLLGCKRVKNCIPKIRTPPLTTRIASSLEEMMIPESGLVANEYVHAPKYFPGFDGRITVMNTVGKDSAHYFYMEVRIAPKKRDSESKARVSKIVKALMSHFICTLQLSLTDQLSSFKNLHVIFYEWGALSDTNEVDLEAVKSAVSSLFAGKTIESVEETNNAHKNDDLLSARQKFLEDVKKVLQDADKNSDAMISNIQKRLLSDDHMREYMRQCFQAYLDAGDDVGKKTHLARAYVVTRQELEQWLVPPVLPIPYLVAEVEKAATDGQTIDADEA